MNKKDPFIEWLKDKILSNPQEPPARTWEQVADSLDLEESWEAISEDLDLERVWEKVDSRLHRFEHLQLFERAAYAVSALAVLTLLLGLWLLPAGVGNQLQVREQFSHSLSLSHSPAVSSGTTAPGKDTPEVKRKPVEGVKRSEEKEEEAQKAAFPQSSTARKRAKATANRAQKSSKPSQTAESWQAKAETPPGREKALALALTPEASVAESRPFYREGRILSLLHGKGFMENALQDWRAAGLHLPDSLSGLPDVPPENKEPFTYRFPAMVAGPGSAIKFSWLMNNKTLTAMEKSSLVKAVATVHTDFFLTYGLRINERSMLQADGYLYDWSGQRYHEYRKGRYGEVEDKLLYRSLGLSLRRAGKKLGFGAMPLYSQYGVGIYGGVLRRAAEHSMEGSLDTRQAYSNWHLGLQAGYGYDLYLNESLLLSYGLQGRMDLLNIYSGTERIPAYFRKTRKLSLDFIISLKYVLKK